MEVTPEVSSLDYANGLTVGGFTVPGLATRRVQTELELRDGQSFVIAGLLDNELTQQLDKIPGISNIPVLGKLFQTRSFTRSKDELLVVVTPQIVGPIPAGMKTPAVDMPFPFIKEGARTPPQTPGPEVTGRLAPMPAIETLPVEQLKTLEVTNGPGGSANAGSPAAAPPLAVPAAPAQSAPPGTPANSTNSSSPANPAASNH